MPPQSSSLSPLARQILALRGINSREAIEAFVNPASYIPLDPEELPGMPQTVGLLLEAVERGDKICVYGDYDTDGVTSTVVLVSLLRLLRAEVEYHVPDRFTEGYGMNESIVRQLAATGVKLILTCDCGVANYREVQVAKELGLSVLLTDHHLLPPQLPMADSIVNPQFLPEGHRAQFLPGVGVAYMLALAVLKRFGKQEQAEGLLDLVAMGIVADVVPLLGENRYLLQLGLDRLNCTSRLGLRTLGEVAGLRAGAITEEEIGFQLVPRVNAAGRISSANLAVELLLTEDESIAKQLATELDHINQQRRKIGEEILEEALSMLDFTYGPRPIVLYRPGWHHGVIGIVAGRLAELYKVPVLLMSLKDDGATITGSARSIYGIHILELLQKCETYLYKYGGHAGAAGFSLYLCSLELFSQAVQHELDQAMDEFVGGESVAYDLPLDLAQATVKNYQELRRLAPFGEGNPVPRFRSQAVRVMSQRNISEQKHIRMVLGQGQAIKQAMWWWGGGQDLPKNVDIVYSLSLNRWQGQENLQLIINDLRECQFAQVVQEQVELIKVRDLRNWQEVGQSLPTMPEASFFLEGKHRLVGLTLQNRYNLASSITLVLLSIPAGLRVLQEIVALSGARTLVLAYGERDAAVDQDFMTQVAGMAKFSMANRAGRVDIPSLAIATGQLEVTVVAGLNYLQARGIIKLFYYSPQEIGLEPGSGRAAPNIAEVESRLKKMLAETRAFRRYMLKAGTENVLNLLGPKGYVSTNKGEVKFGY